MFHVSRAINQTQPKHLEVLYYIRSISWSNNQSTPYHIIVMLMRGVCVLLSFDTTTILSSYTLHSQVFIKNAQNIIIMHTLHILHSKIIIIYHISIHYMRHRYNHNSSKSFVSCINSYAHIMDHAGKVLPQ